MVNIFGCICVDKLHIVYTVRFRRCAAHKADNSDKINKRANRTSDHKAAMNRQESNINNKNDPQNKHRLGTVSKNILPEGLNQFYGANLTLGSDVDQDT